MQSKIVGSSNQGSIAPQELAVDPLFMAARVAQRPLDYSAVGRVLGHYRAVGATAAVLPSANVVLANFRYTDPSSFAVIMGIRASLAVASAVTAQRMDPLAAFIARGYSVQETTNITALTLTGNNQKMRTSPMGSTNAQVGVTSNAAGMTGGTKTVDSNAFGHMGLSSAAIAALGTGAPTQDLYRGLPNASHPPVLAVNEGVVVEWGATALATGTVVVTVEFEWAEVIVF